MTHEMKTTMVTLYGALTSLALGLAACAPDGAAPPDDLAATTSALSDPAQILGFEDATLWTSSQGVKSASTVHSQGAKSLSVQNFGFTAVTSSPLATPSGVTPTLQLDVRPPAVLPWGQIQMFVSIPSRNVFNAPLNSVPIAGLPSTQFSTMSFPVPAAVITALRQSYSDLTFQITVNAPQSSQGFLLDNLRFQDDGSGGSGGSGGSSGSGGAAGTGGTGGTGGTTSLIWPNATSSANSDAWLRQHHDEITEMHPRALVINFVNGASGSTSAVRARWDLMAKAMAEGSRYHAYSDQNAKPFVIHELLKQVDLVDNPIPGGWTKPNSTKTPRVTTASGVRLDYTQLYSQAFADLYAIRDPQNPSHNLTLCELLQKGIINELFIAIDNSEDGITPEIIEYKQMYDSNDQPLVGQFDPFAGNGQFEPTADLPVARACGRSLRVDFLEMNNGLDGALHVLTHNYEHLGTAVPNIERFYAALFNRDFGQRFNTPFNSWYDVSVNGSPTNFLSYPSNQSVSWSCPPDSGCAGQQGVISPFTQGCGNAHYPPNARNSYDYQNTTTVLTRCEHYGLHDGPNGKDLASPYSVQTLANLTQQFGNEGNGGAWQLYLFQSIPGVGSRASTDDGVHIKNFWPYLYY